MFLKKLGNSTSSYILKNYNFSRMKSHF